MIERLIVSVVLALSTMAVDARVVGGKVSGGKKGIPDVLVSDGKNFAVTGKDGRYSIEVDDDAEFVFVITPAGYVANWSSGVPEFYKDAKGDRIDFNLCRVDDRKGYNIVAVADPQPRRDSHFRKFMDAPLSDLTETASALKGQSVGIVLGDICFDAYDLLPRWKEEIVRTGIPFYPVVGNHDHNRAYVTDREAISTYRSLFGPENYAFFLGKDLVVVIDNIIYDGGRSNYTEGYTDAALDWLEGLMKHVPETADVFVAQHSPLYGRGKGDGMIVNSRRILDILDGRELVFLSGHNHVNVVFEHSDNIIEHNVGSICGAHWDTYHCVDGTPCGYKVLTRSKGKLSWYYKSVGKPSDFRHEVFEPGRSLLHPESLVVNVWDYDSLWKVEWYQDGKYMGSMERVEDCSYIHAEELRRKYEGTGKSAPGYRQTKKAAHYFRAVPSEDAGMVTVVVTDRFGRVSREQVRLR